MGAFWICTNVNYNYRSLKPGLSGISSSISSSDCNAPRSHWPCPSSDGHHQPKASRSGRQHQQHTSHTWRHRDTPLGQHADSARWLGRQAGPAPPARWSSSTSPLVQLHQEHDPSGSLLPSIAPLYNLYPPICVSLLLYPLTRIQRLIVPVILCITRL